MSKYLISLLLSLNHSLGTADGMVKKALNSTEGFTLVLAGAKALLEHKRGIESCQIVLLMVSGGS